MKNRISFGVVFKNQAKLVQAFRQGLSTQQKEEEEEEAGRRGSGGGASTGKKKPLPKDIGFPSLLAIEDIDKLTGEWIDVQHHVNQDLLSLSLSRVAAQVKKFQQLQGRGQFLLGEGRNVCCCP